MPERTVFVDFEIDEISGVDRPAQKGARVVIMKRDTEKPSAGGDNEEGVLDELADDSSPDDGKRKTNKEEDTMSDKPKDQAKSPETAALEKRVEKAEAVATMTDAQKAHYGTLEGDAAEAFLKKAPEEREAELAEVSKEDPVVYKDLDGHEYRKSDDERIVASAKRADKAVREGAAAKAAAKKTEFEKRAGEEMAHFPGETEAKVAVLKALEEVPEEHREAAANMVKAADDALGGAFETRGVSTSPTFTKAEDQLDALAKKIQKDSDGKLSYEQAYAKALESSEGREAYQKTVEAAPPVSVTS